jgi:hypothetical protein
VGATSWKLAGKLVGVNSNSGFGLKCKVRLEQVARSLSPIFLFWVRFQNHLYHVGVFLDPAIYLDLAAGGLESVGECFQRRGEQ